MFEIIPMLSWLLLAFTISSASADDWGSLGGGLFPDGLESANDNFYVPAALHPNATSTVDTANLTVIQYGADSETYAWRTNVSNVPLVSSANYNNSSVITNTVYELIMSDTALAHIAARNTTLMYFSFAIPANLTQLAQDDTGDCVYTLGSACADAVVQAYFANPNTIPRQPAACAARMGSGSGVGWPNGFDGDSITAWINGYGSWFSDLSLPTNTTNTDANGFYYGPLILPSSDDPYLRILNWNGVASRAALSHLSSGESAQGNNTHYYQALERLTPVVVAEVEGTGGSRTARWASITCLRANHVTNGSKSLDDENGASSLLRGGVGIGLAGIVASVVAIFVAFV